MTASFGLDNSTQDKVHPRKSHETPEAEKMYSSTLSLTSALECGGWLTQRPGRFTPGKQTRYPLYTRLGGSQGRSERVRKISLPPEFYPQTVQPVASRYTDWAIPANLPKENDVKVYWVYRGHFFLNPSQFIIHQQSYHATL